MCVTPLRLVAAMRTLLALSAVTVIHEAGLAWNWDIANDFEKTKPIFIPPVTKQGVV